MRYGVSRSVIGLPHSTLSVEIGKGRIVRYVKNTTFKSLCRGKQRLMLGIDFVLDVIGTEKIFLDGVGAAAAAAAVIVIVGSCKSRWGVDWSVSPV